MNRATRKGGWSGNLTKNPKIFDIIFDISEESDYYNQLERPQGVEPKGWHVGAFRI